MLRARADAAGADVVVGAVPVSVKDLARGIQLQCRKGRGRVALAADYVLMACGREPNIEVLDIELRRNVERALKIPETGVSAALTDFPSLAYRLASGSCP